MINHVRTLLVNRAADNPASPAYYDACVPAGFREVMPPAAVAAAHAAVMPHAGLLERKLQAFAYLQLLHRPDFLPYLRMFDSRVTYDVESDGLFDAVRLGAQYGLLTYAAALARLSAAFSTGYGELMAAGSGDDAEMVVGLQRIWASSLDCPTRLAGGLYLLVRRFEEVRLHG